MERRCQCNKVQNWQSCYFVSLGILWSSIHCFYITGFEQVEIDFPHVSTNFQPSVFSLGLLLYIVPLCCIVTSKAITTGYFCLHCHYVSSLFALTTYQDWSWKVSRRKSLPAQETGRSRNGWQGCWRTVGEAERHSPKTERGAVFITYLVLLLYISQALSGLWLVDLAVSFLKFKPLDFIVLFSSIQFSNRLWWKSGLIELQYM